ncbi:Uncharacterized HTH-type transcriptional regulator Rv1985c/MT2039 [Raoultella ornithinolytica]|nr:Uncharacterized HTH-type transcriptional regulator Rv1985c/MT2039 [Raoultella ornithinolytica]
MNTDLSGIPVFVAVVECGNFAKAAERLHVTRSAVGKTVARLEARLGAALFQRTDPQSDPDGRGGAVLPAMSSGAGQYSRGGG